MSVSQSASRIRTRARRAGVVTGRQGQDCPTITVLPEEDQDPGDGGVDDGDGGVDDGTGNGGQPGDGGGGGVDSSTIGLLLAAVAIGGAALLGRR